MPKRPPQGRGSGGRVTPAKNSGATSSSSSSSSSRPGAGGAGGTSSSAGKSGKPATSGKPAKPGKDSGSTGSGAGGRTKARVPTAAPGSKRGGKVARPAEPTAANRAGTKSGTKSGTTSGTKPGEDAAPARRGILGLLTGSADSGYVPAAERERPWWGMGDLLLWFIVAQVAAGVAFFVLAGALDYSIYWPAGPGSAIGEVVGRIGAGQAPAVTRTIADMPLWLTTILQVPLWLGFLGGPLYCAWRKGTSLKVDFGFTMKWKDIPVGLGIGLACQLVLITVIYKIIFVFTGEQDVSAQARQLTDKANSPLSILLVLLVVGLGAPVFEELFFRGLGNRSIAKRLGPLWGLVLGAVFFAFAHGQSLQFPGLFAFGLVLGYLALRYERLGPAIWAHVGFNSVTAIVLIWNVHIPWVS